VSFIGKPGGGGGGPLVVFPFGAGGVALAKPFKIPNRKKIQFKKKFEMVFIIKN